MKSKLFLLVVAFSPIGAGAQNNPDFSLGEKAKNVHHTGDVWLHELNTSDSVFNFSITQACFAAGARLDWHQHPGGQILLVTEGVGYYQEKGAPKKVVRKGDVAKCPPNLEHWHGASPEAGVTYLAATPTQKGKTIWGERVTDETYFSTVKTAPDSTWEMEVIRISKDKWRWMAARQVDSLSALLDEKVMFIHMGGNMNKAQELEVIQTGRIQYKHAEIQETSVKIIGNTAILLSKIRLTAIVGSNEVINPFTVTEVFIRDNNTWKLGSLSFSKLLGP